ncbi:MAG: transcriptional repressor [Bacteroidaceae bacterium]
MDQNQIGNLLEHKKIRSTINRINIYQAILQQSNTFSLFDIEDLLLDLDKSTIFRAMTLFEEKHLIHGIEDGSGSKKYCLCPNQGYCQQDEGHCHLHCEVCGTTICLDKITIPEVTIPDGFIVKKANYIIQGICADCAKKKIY